MSDWRHSAVNSCFWLSHKNRTANCVSSLYWYDSNMGEKCTTESAHGVCIQALCHTSNALEGVWRTSEPLQLCLCHIGSSRRRTEPGKDRHAGRTVSCLLPALLAGAAILHVVDTCTSITPSLGTYLCQAGVCTARNILNMLYTTAHIACAGTCAVSK